MQIGLNLTLRAINASARFSPASLFTAGEQGAWYDPSDFSTLFQDSAGTTPVTAVEQPVGLMLDKSKGLVLGSELISNGDFSNGTTGWTAGAGWTLSGGQASVVGTTTLTQPIAGAPKWIRIQFDIVAISGSIAANYNQTNGLHNSQSPIYNTTGTKTTYISINPSATSGLMQIFFQTFSAGQTATIDNISVRELPGNHAFQSTAASRPVLRQEASGAYYLAFDGTDDWLQTNSIDFTSTDKMTVFAGVRKLSDAAIGMPVELSADAGTNNGSFHIQTFANTYGFALRGTGVGLLSATTFTAPVTNVLSSAMDIAQPTITTELLPRINSAIPTLATTLVGPAGTGNFGNYPLYIGRRGGTTLPFNGRLYGLVIRGAASTPQQIAQAEAWMNQRTFAY